MKFRILYLAVALLFAETLISQAMPGASEGYKIHVSKKGVYQIRYNEKEWQIDNKESKWDTEFKDTYELIFAYFTELEHFVEDHELKKTIRAQFEPESRTKKLKVYKKTINGLEVDFFELEVEYKKFIYLYQGFYYNNGRSGTVILQIGGAEANMKRLQPLIDEFFQGFSVVR